VVDLRLTGRVSGVRRCGVVGGVVMRKIVGALILFLTAALYRADHLSRSWISVEATPPHSVSSVPRTTGETPKRKRRAHKVPAVPPDYRRDPLVFFSTAPRDSLTLLPGIGPVLADRIVNARSGKRSFTRWDDLLAIKGIGPKTVERLRKLAEGTGSE
jgi:predicted flap endonuclease-1-like 5' DNA nuclease